MNLSNSSRKDILRLHLRIDALQNQVNELSRQLAQYPTAPRSRWERHSLPELREVDELPTKIMPMVKVERKIARVTLTLGKIQYVTSYDSSGRRIDEYSGLFREVGTAVLAIAGNKPWEIVKAAS